MHTLTGDEQFDLELIQMLACELLIESDCNSLPISPYDSIDYYGNIFFREFAYLSVILKIDRATLAGCFGIGLIYYEPDKDRYWLLVNGDKCTGKRELAYFFSIAFAYIELHMVPPEEFIELTEDMKTVHSFANYYLAPDVIFEECVLTDEINLMHYSLLPFRQVLRKEQELKRKKRHRVKKVNTILERLLLKKFRKFVIKENNDFKNKYTDTK